MNVSFIIPAYNEEATIEACLLSIYSEIIRYNLKTYPNINKFETIVVDNNCTDRTVEIAKKHNAIVVKQPIKGVTHARQAGCDAAKYEIHAYIDADNELPKDWLKNLEILSENNSIVALSGPLHFANQPFWLKVSTKGFWYLNKFAHKFIGVTLQGGNFCVRANIIKKIGHSTNILFFGEDTDLGVRLSRYGKIKLLDTMWVYSSDRRLREQGIINTTFKYVLNYLSVTFLHRPVTLNYTDFRPDEKSNNKV